MSAAGAAAIYITNVQELQELITKDMRNGVNTKIYSFGSLREIASTIAFREGYQSSNPNY